MTDVVVVAIIIMVASYTAVQLFSAYNFELIHTSLYCTIYCCIVIQKWQYTYQYTQIVLLHL